MLPVIQFESALKTPDAVTHFLTDAVRTIKLLQPLRSCIGERELHGDSGLIRAAHMENHDTALGHIIRGDGERRDSLDLGERRNRERDDS